MSPIARRTFAVCCSLVLAALAGVGFAQDGVSTAGAARSRYLSNLGVLPSAREVAVEDFVNYHRHEIGRPKAGEAVGLDVRWGSESVAPGGEAVLQVGLSTALAHDRQQLRPLNLALVIDKSGSMAESDKLSRVKAALTNLVSSLRPSDVLSIVVFDSEAQVLFPAQRASDPGRIKDLIREIQPGSATNINAGLMLGYQQALKLYRKESTNRVILLTDGIANRGVTEPEKIAQGSLAYNDRGIDLSTIGVGLDLNKDLLRDLAKSGRGLFHFVADAEDIDKVFVKELQSLVSPVATEPNLEIEFGPGLELQNVFGYQPKTTNRTVRIKLDNMNSGMTEVVMLRMRARRDSEQSRLPVTVRLTYYDLERKRTIERQERATVLLSSKARTDAIEDSSVAKNYTIALLAQSIHDMAAASEVKRYREAEGYLSQAIAKTSRRYPNLDDADIRRTLSMAQKYQEVLRREIGVDPKGGDDALPWPSGENIVPNGDFSRGNWGFTSDLPYIAPKENCLWEGRYTVAPRFQNPLLHRLIAPEDYAAPRRPNGAEQVLYANAGVEGALVVWSAKVKCKPNMTYRVSFQSIGLTPGAEWTPTYEIRVNSDRSEAQPSQYGSFVEISTEWSSKGATTATVSIVRMPMAHRCGLIGISNIEMVPVLLARR